MKVSELGDLDNIAALCALMTDHGNLPCFMIHGGYARNVEDAEGFLEESYAGAYHSLADWAHEALEDAGALQGLPKNLQGYFDFEAYAEDCEKEGSIFTVEVDGRTYVFFSDR